MDRIVLQPVSVLPVGAVERRREALVYVDAMLVELGFIARREQLDMLAYLIDMAHGEAVDQIRRDPAGPASITSCKED